MRTLFFRRVFGGGLLAASLATAARACLLYIVDPETLAPLVIPLESTEVVLDVKPGLVEAEVVQTFHNRTNTALEATYVYPLPADATLTGFELRFRDRVVRSEVREKRVAQAIYDAAKAEGRKAAVLHQRDPALFSTAVANFLPGEKVEVAIRFIQPVKLTSRAVEVRFPMVTGDKYFPAGTTPGMLGNAAANPTRMPAGGMAENHVYAFDVQVAGFPVQSIESASHRVKVTRAEDAAVERYAVALAEEITIPDRDFVLRIELRGGAAVESSVVMQRTKLGDFGMFTVFPPAERPRGQATPKPRDVLFLLDRSGSMEGPRFEHAKAGLLRCLDALQPRDRFHVVVFDDRYDFFESGWTRASAAAIERAREQVRELRVRGGTEVQPALAAALAAFEPNDRQQILIFLTDGDVGNPSTLLSLVESKIGQVRLFPFGIGSAPNATLIGKMAELGRGQARYIANDADVERELVDLFATLDAPVLSNVSVSLLDAEGVKVESLLLPSVVPDVFLGRPVQGVFRALGGAPASVRIEGVEGARPVAWTVPVGAQVLRGDGMEKRFGARLYAETEGLLRRTQTDAERTIVRQEMLETALQFQLVTELTSRVAVDQVVSREASAPLASQHVGQYRPADQVAAVTASANGEVLVLTPFTVQSEADRGYATSMSSDDGRRAGRGIGDAIGRKPLEEFAPRVMEEARLLALETQQAPARAQAGAHVGRLNGLPITTVPDLATVEEVRLQSFSPAASEIVQARPSRRDGGTLTLRAGEDGFAMAALRIARSERDAGMPWLGVLSWSRMGDDRWSAYLAGERVFGATVVRANVQARELEGFGAMRLGRIEVERRSANEVTFGATLAGHALRRDDPWQFGRGSPTGRYDGLGILGLDRLTAATRGWDDAIAAVHASGRIRSSDATHHWSARGRWHGAEAEWSVPTGAENAGTRRRERALDLSYRGTMWADMLEVDLAAGAAKVGTAGATRERATAGHAAATVNWMVFGGWSVFASGGQERALPWISTGRWTMDGSEWRAVAPELERREGGQAGVRFEGDGRRLSFQMAAFRERVTGTTYRDWAGEAEFGSEELFRVEAGGGVRGRISMATWPVLEREGWTGTVTWSPSRAFTTRLSWQTGMRGVALRGGHRQGSVLVRYEAMRGAWRGWSVAGLASYRNALGFADGHELSGDVRGDVVLGYRWLGWAGRDTRVHLNWANVTDRAWQWTRFAREHGREVVLSVMQEF